MKIRKLLILVLVVLFVGVNLASADIFGPRKADKLGAGDKSILEPTTVLDTATEIINYLGVRGGYMYDFSAKEWVLYSGATLYTYEPWKLALDIGMLNTDGVGLTLDFNIGDLVPAENVPIMEYFKYLYVGGGLGARYDSNTEKWDIAPIVGAQVKVTF